MKIEKHFAGQTRTFEMTFPLAHIFERDQRKSLYGVFNSILQLDFRVSDIEKVLHLALQGGGMDDQDAYELVQAHVASGVVPIAIAAELARDVLDAAYFGNVVKQEADRVFGSE